jgi:hypothetical protein
MRILFIIVILFAFPIMGLSREYKSTHEIKAGMKGIGKTVFQGTRVDSFDVEILGVLRNTRPKGSIIIGRLSGGPADAHGTGSLIEKTGIIAGMSGSPVYIDGELIGALAFAWPFAKEPIAGITPISEMLQIIQTASQTGGEKGMGLGMIEDLKFEVTERSLNHGGMRQIPSTFEMVPIQTPLYLSGLDERSINDARELFEPYGLLPVQGGIFESPESEASLLQSDKSPISQSTLEPGSVIGVQLVTGDLRAGAIGTVTEKNGEQILAFGHPYLWTGNVDFPITTGYIHSILPSRFVSFKMGSTGEIVGRLFQDRRAGIFGKLGEYSEMIPVEVEIQREVTDNSGQSIKKIDTYNYEIIQEKRLTSGIAGFLSLNSVNASAVTGGDMAMKLDLSLEMRSPSGEFTVQRSDLYSGDDSPTISAREVVSIVDALLNNPYETVEASKIRVKVDLFEGMNRNGRIEALYVDKGRAKPGDTIQATYFYRPHRGERIRNTLSITLPEDLPEGKVELRVLDGKTLARKELEKNAAKYEHKNFTQFIDFIRRERHSNDVWVQLVLSRKGFMIKGKELPALPPSLLSILSTSEEAGEGETIKEDVILEKRFSTDYILTGKETQSIDIVRQ